MGLSLFHSFVLCFALSSEAGSHVAQADHRTLYLAEDDFELLTFLSLSPRAAITCRPSNPPTFDVGIGGHAYILCTWPTEPPPRPHRRNFNEYSHEGRQNVTSGLNSWQAMQVLSCSSDLMVQDRRQDSLSFHSAQYTVSSGT